jgi:hypothetical protein
VAIRAFRQPVKGDWAAVMSTRDWEVVPSAGEFG